MVRKVTYEEIDGYLWEVENIDGYIRKIRLSKIEAPKSNKKNKIEDAPTE